MADVALTRLKANGQYYDAGEEVPGDLEDAESLKERGIIGSAADYKKHTDEVDAAVEAAEAAEAEAAKKREEADALSNEATALVTPNTSVTDEEAKALNKKDDEEPAPKATSAKSGTSDK